MSNIKYKNIKKYSQYIDSFKQKYLLTIYYLK
jgi:hypothetical protein